MKKLFILILYFLFLSPVDAQQFLWGRYGIGNGEVENAKTDNRGNCYAVGLFQNDTIHFGGYTLMNSYSYGNYEDAFIVKYDPKGNLLWARQWFSQDTSLLHVTFAPASVATDNKGNVCLNADFTDSLEVGTDTVVNTYNYGCTCVTKYDSNGNIKWVRHSKNSIHTDSVSASGNHVTADKFGDFYLMGVGSYDTVYFGSHKLYYNHNFNFNDFLVKYDSSGNVKWAKQAVPKNSNSGCVSYCATTDDHGDIYTTGVFGDTVEYGPYMLTAHLVSAGDFQIVKWDSSGNVIWAKQGYPANVQPAGAAGISVTLDKHGNVYACGQFFGGVVIGQDTIQQYPGNQNNFFVVKYSPAGIVIWVKQATILDGSSWLAWSIASDTNNNIYLTGNGGSTDTCKFAFGGDTLKLIQTNPTPACFLLKLDTNGRATCGVIMQEGGGDWTSVTSDASGRHVYFAASFSTTAIFGPDTVKPNSFPINHIQGRNYFPTVARWEACDSNIFQAVPEVQKPLNNVSVYPNPNNGNFIIALQNVNTPAQVEIYNMLGEKVQSEKLNAANNTQIEMTSQASGVYFYRVLQENGSLIGSGKVMTEK